MRALRKSHPEFDPAGLYSAASPEQARGLVRSAPRFDADGYKILFKPLLSGRQQVVLL